MAVVVAALLITVQTDNNFEPDTPSLHLPRQTLFSTSVRQENVPAWKVTGEELGMRPGTGLKPFKRFGEGRTYFAGLSDDGVWLVGLDVRTGRPLFDAVLLGPFSGASVDCMANGPNVVLCIRDDPDPALPGSAWVVNVDGGAVTYHGPTDFRVHQADGKATVAQWGDFTIAVERGVGVHGVGPDARPTWFVPGDGLLRQTAEWPSDIERGTLAVQGGKGAEADIVFSVVDGRVLEPETSHWENLGRARTFADGFVYEYTDQRDGTDRVIFFDESGRAVRRPNVIGQLGSRSPDLPLVQTSTRDMFFTVDGELLLDLSNGPVSPEARLIGERLFVSTDVEHKIWRQFDLHSGTEINSCVIEDLRFSYLGSDGSVAIIAEGSGAQAIDLDTCQQLWSVPGSNLAEARQIWNINGALIQRVNDELAALATPR